MKYFVRILNTPLSRKNYWYYQFALLGIGGILELLSKFIFKKGLLEKNYLNYLEIISEKFSWYTSFKVLFIIIIVAGIILQIRRFLDIGWPKYLPLLSFIPLLNIFTTGACLFIKGNTK